MHRLFHHLRKMKLLTIYLKIFHILLGKMKKSQYILIPMDFLHVMELDIRKILFLGMNWY